MHRHLIVNKLKSDYYIVTSKYAHEAECFAASELQKYIYKSTKTLLPYFSDRCEKKAKEILIGFSARNNYLNLKTKVKDDGFIIKSIDDDILIAGNNPRGTLYGVYYFLEKFLDFRCYTKDDEKINCLECFSIDEVDIIENPSFYYRDAYFRNAFDSNFASKNKLNGSMADLSNLRGGKIKFYSFHHTFDELVPPDKYYNEHPEYFSLINGERLKERTQLCLTNPDVLEIATKKVLSLIKENPDCKIFSVAQNDWYNYCTCENCRKVDEYENSHSGTLINFVNKIAKAVYKKHPDILLHTLAYQYTKEAPKFVKPYKNVIVRLCNIEASWEKPIYILAKENPKGEAAKFLNNIKNWSKICKNLYIWDYAVNFNNYLQPFVHFHTMAENIKLYKEYNIQGVLQEGNFSYGGGFALDDLKAYVISKLLWNSDYNVDDIIDDFLQGFYKNSARYIKEYINIWEDAVRNKILTIYQDTDADYINDNLINKSEELFKKAVSEAANETIKKRIEKELLSIKYVKLSRLPMDFPNRENLIDNFYDEIREFGLTELFERCSLDISVNIMKNSRYCKNRESKDLLYYLMK